MEILHTEDGRGRWGVNQQLTYFLAKEHQIVPAECVYAFGEYTKWN